MGVEKEEGVAGAPVYSASAPAATVVEETRNLNRVVQENRNVNGNFTKPEL